MPLYDTIGNMLAASQTGAALGAQIAGNYFRKRDDDYRMQVLRSQRAMQQLQERQLAQQLAIQMEARDLEVQRRADTEKAWARIQAETAPTLPMQVPAVPGSTGSAGMPIQIPLPGTPMPMQIATPGMPGTPSIPERTVQVPNPQRMGFEDALEKHLLPVIGRYEGGQKAAAAALDIADMRRKKLTSPNPLSTIGREQEDLRRLEASGNTEAVARFKAAQAQRDASKGEVVKLHSDGTVEILKGGAKSTTTTTTTRTRAEEAINRGANFVSLTSNLVRLAQDPGNVGVRGNLSRLWQDLAGQFIPMEAGEEFDFAQTATWLKADATAILKSDSQITDDERKSIVSQLPSADIMQSSKTVQARGVAAMRKVADSARRQILNAGLKLPPELMTKEEIKSAFKKGEMTEEEATQALLKSMSNLIP